MHEAGEGERHADRQHDVEDVGRIEEATLERRHPGEAAQLMWIPERQAPVGHAAIERLVERQVEDPQVHARHRDLARDEELDRPPENHEGGDAERPRCPERARWPLLHLAGRRPSAPRARALLRLREERSLQR